MLDEPDHQVRRAMTAMEEHTGTVTGFRRSHPRGIHYRATFTPSPEMAEYTIAEHFSGPPISTLVRLSNATGSPYAPDRKPDGHGAILGLAVRFELPSGTHASWAAVNLTNFPARTPEEFITIANLGARITPRLLAHVATHRHIIPGLKSIASQPITASFATTRYNGLHAYYLVAPDGTRRVFRYSWIPDAGEHTLGAAEIRDWPPQYLISEIKQRHNVSWTLQFSFAGPGDPVDDVTRQWPPKPKRRTIDAGTLTLNALVDDQSAVEYTVFDPTGVVPGIELSDDPILHFRSRVYSESHARRHSETKPRITPE